MKTWKKKSCDYWRIKQEIKTEMESRDKETLNDVWVKAYFTKRKRFKDFWWIITGDERAAFLLFNVIFFYASTRKDSVGLGEEKWQTRKKPLKIPSHPLVSPATHSFRKP